MIMIEFSWASSVCSALPCPSTALRAPRGRPRFPNPSLHVRTCIFFRNCNIHCSKIHCTFSSYSHHFPWQPVHDCHVRIYICCCMDKSLFLHKFGIVKSCIWRYCHYYCNCYHRMRSWRSWKVRWAGRGTVGWVYSWNFYILNYIINSYLCYRSFKGYWNLIESDLIKN